VKLGKSDRLVGGPAQSLQQPLLLGVSEASSTDCRPVARFWADRAFRSRAARIGGFGRHPPLRPAAVG
jgi:hypothetical protein